jgi:hypothetical protein
MSLFGLAMTRMIALRMAADGIPGTDEAFGFAVRRWLRALLAPIPCVLVLAISVGGEVFLRTAVAPQEGSLLGAGVYLASFGLGLVAVGAALFLIVGGQLWLPCLAVEDAGIGHAIGTAFLFAVRRPWTCLLYEAAVLLRSAVIIAVIRQPFASLSWGGIIIGVAQGIVLVIAGGYVFAALLATPVAAYLSIRSAVSGASRTEVQR